MFLKVIVLAAFIAAVWYGFKFVAGRNKAKQAQVGSNEVEHCEEMEACSACGTFVLDNNKNCGRTECPYTE
ncbi:MAG: hypothetical protein VYB39_00035 [Pseudomonadota bacterium]|nr:hypothetical protein [Pseudomonadota bacterium]